MRAAALGTPRTPRFVLLSGHDSGPMAPVLAALRIGGREFPRFGDLIAIEDETGQVIGHGLTAYSAADTRVILGHKSREIEGLLGYRGRDEVVHADNLVMLEQGG